MSVKYKIKNGIYVIYTHHVVHQCTKFEVYR